MILRDTVTRTRAAQATDAYGNQQPDWNNTISAAYPAAVGPVGTDEQVVDEQRTVSRWRMFLQPDADVIATDRITWDGATYEIDGDVQLWKRGRRAHHKEALLIKVTQG